MVIIVNWTTSHQELHRELAGIRCEIMEAMDTLESTIMEVHDLYRMGGGKQTQMFMCVHTSLQHLRQHLQWALSGGNCYNKVQPEKCNMEDG